MGAEKLKARVEQLIRGTPKSVIKEHYDLIAYAIQGGLSMAQVAELLTEEGYGQINQGHIIRHLGEVRREKGLPPFRSGRKTKPKGASKEVVAGPLPLTQATPTDVPAANFTQVAEQHTHQPAAASPPPSAPQSEDEELPQAIQDKIYVMINGEWLDVRKDMPAHLNPVDLSFRSNPRSPTKEEMEAINKEKVSVTEFNRARWLYLAEVKKLQKNGIM